MTWFHRLRILAVILVVAILFGITRPAFAQTYAGTTVFTCTTFTAAGTGSSTLDRDNTGVGQEKDRIEVTDGNGVLLYSLTFQNGLGVYAAGLINTTLYTVAPTANPITLKVISLAGNSLPELVQYVASGSCAGLPDGNFAGPGVPAGFVLKTITCNVAVYDAPGGKPVGSNAITSGQTWYVNPTPKKDAAGKSWTEVFVAGYSNGFVPTSCVH
jgi:hypothetical protein